MAGYGANTGLGTGLGGLAAGPGPLIAPGLNANLGAQTNLGLHAAAGLGPGVPGYPIAGYGVHCVPIFSPWSSVGTILVLYILLVIILRCFI